VRILGNPFKSSAHLIRPMPRGQANFDFIFLVILLSFLSQTAGHLLQA